jgi:predicted  nucleic acid-binding Zn-ribbon protein
LQFRGLRVQVVAGVVGVTVAALLTSCGSSGASAAQQVCSDRSQLNQSVSTVVSDLRSGNFSKAKDNLSAVTTAFDNLQSSVQQLASEQSKALSPQIDTLKSTVSSLKDSSSLSELLDGIDAARSQAQSISTQIGDSLQCS